MNISMKSDLILNVLSIHNFCKTQDKIRAMNMWLKYGQVLNDPVRNLNIRLAFQSSNVTDAQLARGNFTTFDV